jgi:3-deoxy-D-manno-octulosonic-acid transferase
MMLILYRILWVLASPLLALAAALNARRKGDFAARFGGKLPTAKDHPVWVHAASVGEVNSVRPLLAHLRERKIPLLVTTFTVTGLDHLRGLFPDLPSSLLPLELPWAINRAITSLQPRAFLQVESDFWPLLLAELAARKIPMALVNGRIGERASKRLRNPVFKRGLAGFGLWLVQDDQMAERSRPLLPPALTPIVTGNFKWGGYDFTPAPELEVAVKTALDWQNDTVLIIGASTHAPEEEMLLECFARLSPTHPNLRLLLAPRHTDRATEITGIAQRLGIQSNLRTSSSCSPASVLILDTFGELVKLYRLASIVFVGGSLRPERGGQDPVAAALCGAAIVMGPYMRNFRREAEALSASGGVLVNKKIELCNQLEQLLADPARIKRLGEKAKALFAPHLGGLGKTIAQVDAWLDALPH